ncbi:MAG: hypothetical protein KF852_14185 [Saprospiraceae bacterium]|nr:hypothetical protein [Saprospiraceae bacterium]
MGKSLGRRFIQLKSREWVYRGSKALANKAMGPGLPCASVSTASVQSSKLPFATGCPPHRAGCSPGAKRHWYSGSNKRTANCPAKAPDDRSNAASAPHHSASRASVSSNISNRSADKREPPKCPP